MMLSSELQFARAAGREEIDERWSPRRTLTFIMTSNLLGWWLIASALRAF